MFMFTIRNHACSRPCFAGHQDNPLYRLLNMQPATERFVPFAPYGAHFGPTVHFFRLRRVGTLLRPISALSGSTAPKPPFSQNICLVVLSKSHEAIHAGAGRWCV